MEWLKILAAALILTWCVYPNALALAYAWLNPSPEDWMRKARRLRDGRNVAASWAWMTQVRKPGGYTFGSQEAVTAEELMRKLDMIDTVRG